MRLGESDAHGDGRKKRPSLDLPLFVIEKGGERTRASSFDRFGQWIINPALISVGLGKNPNTGQGLDDAQLRELIARLTAVTKALSSEIERRGRPRDETVTRGVEIYRELLNTDTDRLKTWKKIRVVLDSEKQKYEDWSKLKAAIRLRVKRDDLREQCRRSE